MEIYPKVLSFGCSLIYGTDLSDDGRNLPYAQPSHLSWPALIAKRLGFEYATNAHGGGGNLQIMDRTLSWTYYAPACLMIVGWSFIDRFDYSDPNGCHFNKGMADYRTLSPVQETDLARVYYRDFHSEYRDKLTNLMYMKTSIDFLKARDCRFIMTAIDDLLWDTRYNAPPVITDLQQYVRPYITDFEGKNFITWSRDRGFAISDTLHPLEEAHAAAAELLWPKVERVLA